MGLALILHKAAAILVEQQTRSDALRDEITGGEEVNLWRKHEVYELCVGHQGTPWPLKEEFYLRRSEAMRF